MLTDKNGKEITVGARVKLPDGSHARVKGMLIGSTQLAAAGDVEVVGHAKDGEKAADGDSIIWGS